MSQMKAYYSASNLEKKVRKFSKLLKHRKKFNFVT